MDLKATIIIVYVSAILSKTLMKFDVFGLRYNPIFKK